MKMSEIKTKKVYCFDTVTKEYIGEDIAFESPLEPGVFLIPPNATEKAPPFVGENEVAVFDEKIKDWVVKPDFRKYTYSLVDDNGFFKGIVKLEIGEVPSKYHLLVEPPSPDIYKPKWDGTKWVDGEVKPLSFEQILSQAIAQLTLENADLKAQLQTLAQTIANMQLGGV
jgi:hypothetical protein